jgi:hypothetical protein
LGKTNTIAKLNMVVGYDGNNWSRSADGDDPIKKSPYFQTAKTHTKYTRNGLKFSNEIKLIEN